MGGGMKSWLIALIFAILFSWSASAQVPMTGAGLGVPASSGATYVGPGDLQASVAAWGLRAYSSATRGNKLINACNSTGGIDVGCADMLSDATTGLLVPATIATITCPGTNCTIKTWYDISGNTNCTGTACDQTDAVISARATLTANCLNTTFPCATYAGAQTYATANTLTQAQPFTISFVGERTGTFTSNNSVVGANAGTDFICGFSSTANTAGMYAGSAVVNKTEVADSAFHAVQCFFNGAASTFYVDGSVSGSVNPGTNGSTAAVALGTDSLSNRFTGLMTEAQILNGSITGQSAYNSNQHTFWGF
jgi:hypothetical protein